MPNSNFSWLCNASSHQLTRVHGFEFREFPISPQHDDTGPTQHLGHTWLVHLPSHRFAGISQTAHIWGLSLAKLRQPSWKEQSCTSWLHTTCHKHTKWLDQKTIPEIHKPNTRSRCHLSTNRIKFKQCSKLEISWRGVWEPRLQRLLQDCHSSVKKKS
jgi:hypothetical protein